MKNSKKARSRAVGSCSEGMVWRRRRVAKRGEIEAKKIWGRFREMPEVMYAEGRERVLCSCR